MLCCERCHQVLEESRLQRRTSLACVEMSWALRSALAFSSVSLLVHLHAGIASSLNCACVKVTGPVVLVCPDFCCRWQIWTAASYT